MISTRSYLPWVASRRMGAVPPSRPTLTLVAASFLHFSSDYRNGDQGYHFPFTPDHAASSFTSTLPVSAELDPSPFLPIWRGVGLACQGMVA